VKQPMLNSHQAESENCDGVGNYCKVELKAILQISEFYTCFGLFLASNID